MKKIFIFVLAIFAVVSESSIASTVNSNAISAVDKNIIIQADTTPANQHLAYRAFDIINNSTQPYKIIKLEFVPNSMGDEANDALGFCYDVNNTYCPHVYATFCTEGDKLPPGDRCKVWVRAMDGQPIGPQTEDLIIEAQNTVHPKFAKQQIFKITYSRDLYAAGEFSYAGYKKIPHLAKWDGNSWSPLKAGGDAIIGGGVYTLLIARDGDLYIGGGFLQIDGQNLKYIAKWNGNSWSSIKAGGDGFDDNVYALAMGTYLFNTPGIGYIYAAGNFTHAGDSFGVKRGIARWNPVLKQWRCIEDYDDGFNNTITALVTDNYNTLIYVGGDFTQAGHNPEIQYLAKHYENAAPHEWQPIRPGNNAIKSATVDTIAVDNKRIFYVGGWLNFVSTTQPRFLMKWDGNSWSSLKAGGDGFNQRVSALAIGTDNALYAGGLFTQVDGNPQIQYIAKWDGNSWSPLKAGGDGFNRPIHAIIVDGGNVYVSGDFTQAGGNPQIQYIAKWDGNSWSSLGAGGDGFNNGASSMTIAPSIQSVQVQ